MAAAIYDPPPSWKYLLKGRTPEQKVVIKYFKKPVGAFSINIPDKKFDALVYNKIESMNFRQRALDKLDLDESQINEIEPVHFDNYYGLGLDLQRDKDKERYIPKHIWLKEGMDGKWRTNVYQVSWLFFSDKQVYAYQYTLSLNDDSKNERTEEYFYRDITNFSTISKNAESETWIQEKGCLGIGKKFTPIRINTETDRFALIVPGDEFYCEIRKNDYSEGSIRAMKHKLREKKG